MSELCENYHSIINSRLSMQNRISAMVELYNTHLSFRLNELMPVYLIESIISAAFIDFHQNARKLLESCGKRDVKILARILTGLSYHYLPSCKFSTPTSDAEMLENIGAQMEFEARKFNIAFLFIKRILNS